MQKQNLFDKLNTLIDELDDRIWELDSFLELDEELEILENLKEISKSLRKLYDN